MLDLRRRTLAASYEDDDGFVDLGLPSGILWAKGNIVSDGNGGYTIGEETDYGAFVSWGNIDPHFSSNGSKWNDSYNWGTSVTGAPYKNTAGKNLTETIPFGDIDHDAVSALLGLPCSLPTKDNFQELYDYTDQELVTIGGVSGYKFMKKTNHSIYVFFPRGGQGYSTSCRYRGTTGYYWSSTWYSSNNAYFMRLTDSAIAIANTNKYYGFSIRAIKLNVDRTITLNLYKFDSNYNQIPAEGGLQVHLWDSQGIEHFGVSDSSGHVTLYNVANGACKIKVIHYRSMWADYHTDGTGSVYSYIDTYDVNLYDIPVVQWTVDEYQLNVDSSGNAWLSLYDKTLAARYSPQIDILYTYPEKDYRLIATTGKRNSNISKLDWILTSGSVDYTKSPIQVSFTTVTGESHTHSYSTNGTKYALTTPMVFSVGETITRIS